MRRELEGRANVLLFIVSFVFANRNQRTRVHTHDTQPQRRRDYSLQSITLTQGTANPKTRAQMIHMYGRVMFLCVYFSETSISKI
uniref:Putative secreted protein n=1 Tax=Amblyomma cajennense TaxID=34607 RepID=A0A023FBB6_AMBCJ